MSTNQLTCTTNMILVHYMHRLWGLQRSKVLKPILHCNWKIFISPGNSSETEIIYLGNQLVNKTGSLLKVRKWWISVFIVLVALKAFP